MPAVNRSPFRNQRGLFQFRRILENSPSCMARPDNADSGLSRWFSNTRAPCTMNSVRPGINYELVGKELTAVVLKVCSEILDARS